MRAEFSAIYQQHKNRYDIRMGEKRFECCRDLSRLFDVVSCHWCLFNECVVRFSSLVWLLLFRRLPSSPHHLMIVVLNIVSRLHINFVFPWNNSCRDGRYFPGKAVGRDQSLLSLPTTWVSGLATNCIRLALNGTILGLLKISFSTFWS